VSPRDPASRCAAPKCDYAYAASAPTLQLPLLLSAADLDSLLHAGVPREVGALVAAHLSANPYKYGLCPKCGAAELRATAARVVWSPLLLVERTRTPAEHPNPNPNPNSKPRTLKPNPKPRTPNPHSKPLNPNP